MAILALMLSACIKSTSAMGGNARKDAGGRVTLLDTPQMRADAADSYDRTIEMEKRGHVLSDGMTWNDRWINTIRAIRGNTENPEWYVQYIIRKRREAGLPELTGLDDPEP
ncbi:hypothetical protein EDC50_2312 [Vulcaniibacterium tengchongense]|uniref:Uncharacterized protein n=2 Tax=Vulcaniibacterium tengchongense TaxID=1273429 RepID=A0A3N4VJ38_9GAMM|nr:hypothetical protein EDC50_2312 [Vulcaniibacterium tengchongense]